MRETLVKFYIDLDDTLIDTYRFWLEAHKEVSKNFDYAGFDPEIEGKREKLLDFYVDQDDGLPATYSFDKHLDALGLGGQANDIYKFLANSKYLKQCQLETPGTDELIQYLKKTSQITILTYGYDRIQRLKVATCLSLAELRLISTLKAKDRYLMDEERVDPDTQRIVVLDDTNRGEEMSKIGIQFIHTPFTDTSKNRAKKAEQAGKAMWPLRADSPKEAIKILEANLLR